MTLREAKIAKTKLILVEYSQEVIEILTSAFASGVAEGYASGVVPVVNKYAELLMKDFEQLERDYEYGQ